MKILGHWLILTLAVLASTYLIAGISVSSFITAIVVGLCLAFINLIVKPIINILTLPLNIITLGLFSLVINGAVFYWLGMVVRGFSVDTFKAAFLGALLVSVLNWFGNMVLHD